VKNPAVQEAGPEGLAVLHRPRHHPPPRNGQRLRRKVAAEHGRGEGRRVQRPVGLEPAADHVAKTTARPEFSLIALVCAGYEKTIAKDSWRHPSQTHRDYLNQLVLWGYKTSTVEQLIIDSGTLAEEKPKRHKNPLAGRNPPPGKVPADHHERARNLPKVGRSAARGEPQ
jgi:hypothetical protein